MYEVYGVVLLPIVIGLVKLVELTGFPVKFLPIISLIIGITIGIFYLAPYQYLKGTLLGINLGLAAVGLNSGYKNIKEEITK